MRDSALACPPVPRTTETPRMMRRFADAISLPAKAADANGECQPGGLSRKVGTPHSLSPNDKETSKSPLILLHCFGGFGMMADWNRDDGYGDPRCSSRQRRDPCKAAAPCVAMGRTTASRFVRLHETRETDQGRTAVMTERNRAPPYEGTSQAGEKTFTRRHGDTLRLHPSCM